MPLQYPYKRTCRQFVDGSYTNNGQWKYIHDKDFAESPEHYVRAFELIQKDLIHLFSYVEPSDKNLDTYSFRIYELFFRTCVEIEANFKAILCENRYTKPTHKLNISDYKLINQSHRLSSYWVKIPYWRGEQDKITPFEKFALFDAKTQNKQSTPDWYNAYTSVKHNRLANFEQANLKNLMGAVCALVVVLSSQFCCEDFSPGATLLACEGTNDGLDSAIGGYFRVKFPDDWTEDERYSFTYNSLVQDDWKVQCYDYNSMLDAVIVNC
nr:hypothetical protein [Candidatus Cloacimonadota bacterium]